MTIKEYSDLFSRYMEKETKSEKDNKLKEVMTIKEYSELFNRYIENNN